MGGAAILIGLRPWGGAAGACRSNQQISNPSGTALTPVLTLCPHHLQKRGQSPSMNPMCGIYVSGTSTRQRSSECYLFIFLPRGHQKGVLANSNFFRYSNAERKSKVQIQLNKIAILRCTKHDAFPRCFQGIKTLSYLCCKTTLIICQYCYHNKQTCITSSSESTVFIYLYIS